MAKILFALVALLAVTAISAEGLRGVDDAVVEVVKEEPAALVEEPVKEEPVEKEEPEAEAETNDDEELVEDEEEEPEETPEDDTEELVEEDEEPEEEDSEELVEENEEQEPEEDDSEEFVEEEDEEPKDEEPKDEEDEELVEDEAAVQGSRRRRRTHYANTHRAINSIQNSLLHEKRQHHAHMGRMCTHNRNQRLRHHRYRRTNGFWSHRTFGCSSNSQFGRASNSYYYRANCVASKYAVNKARRSIAINNVRRSQATIRHMHIRIRNNNRRIATSRRNIARDSRSLNAAKRALNSIQSRLRSSGKLVFMEEEKAALNSAGMKVASAFLDAEAKDTRRRQRGHVNRLRHLIAQFILKVQKLHNTALRTSRTEIRWWQAQILSYHRTIRINNGIIARNTRARAVAEARQRQARRASTFAVSGADNTYRAATRFMVSAKKNSYDMDRELRIVHQIRLILHGAKRHLNRVSARTRRTATARRVH